MKVYADKKNKGELGWIKDLELVDDIKKCELVVFIGDGDIYPKLYGALTTELSTFNKTGDLESVQLFIEAQKYHKPCLGINRGYLLISAMAGSQIIQDMKHTDKHKIYLVNGEKFNVDSDHHQMADPTRVINQREYFIIANSSVRSKSYMYDAGNKANPFSDPEIIFYDNINSLACLFYPNSEELAGLLNRLIDSMMKGTVRKDFASKEDPKKKKTLSVWHGINLNVFASRLTGRDGNSYLTIPSSRDFRSPFERKIVIHPDGVREHQWTDWRGDIQREIIEEDDTNYRFGTDQHGTRIRQNRETTYTEYFREGRGWNEFRTIGHPTITWDIVETSYRYGRNEAGRVLREDLGTGDVQWQHDTGAWLDYVRQGNTIVWESEATYRFGTDTQNSNIIRQNPSSGVREFKDGNLWRVSRAPEDRITWFEYPTESVVRPEVTRRIDWMYGHNEDGDEIRWDEDSDLYEIHNMETLTWDTYHRADGETIDWEDLDVDDIFPEDDEPEELPSDAVILNTGTSGLTWAVTGEEYFTSNVINMYKTPSFTEEKDESPSVVEDKYEAQLDEIKKIIGRAKGAKVTAIKPVNDDEEILKEYLKKGDI